jgi:hypothetical protein
VPSQNTNCECETRVPSHAMRVPWWQRAWEMRVPRWRCACRCCCYTPRSVPRPRLRLARLPTAIWRMANASGTRASVSLTASCGPKEEAPARDGAHVGPVRETHVGERLSVFLELHEVLLRVRAHLQQAGVIVTGGKWGQTTPLQVFRMKPLLRSVSTSSCALISIAQRR